MTPKLQSVLDRYEKLNELIADQSVISDINSYRKYTKELYDMTETVEKIKELVRYENEKADAEGMLSLETDPDMRDLLSAEIKELIKKVADTTQELKLLLIPKDENDDRSVIVEIRAGAGGDEAALFASELMRMYMMYAEKHHFKSETLSLNDIQELILTKFREELRKNTIKKIRIFK